MAMKALKAVFGAAGLLALPVAAADLTDIGHKGSFDAAYAASSEFMIPPDPRGVGKAVAEAVRMAAPGWAVAEAARGEAGIAAPRKAVAATKGKNGKDAKGRNGRVGKDGKDGQDGRPGRDGRSGRDGRAGKDGKDANGAKGRDGASGKNGQDGNVNRSGSPEAKKKVRQILRKLGLVVA